MTWKGAVCRASFTPVVSDLTECVSAFSPVAVSPIDNFYLATRELVRVGSPKALASHPPLGALLAVGAISATELYVREILGFVLGVCPVARAKAKEKAIPIGSVFWHPGQIPETAAFEGVSLAGADEIRKLCETYVGFSIAKTSMTFAALEKFDKYCELRHGIVHSNRIVASKNAVALSIPKTATGLVVNIDYPRFQEVVSVCTSVVISMNIELFEEMCRRWAVEWHKRLDIDNFHARLALLRKVWRAFFSKVDMDDGAIHTPMSFFACARAVIRQYRVAR